MSATKNSSHNLQVALKCQQAGLSIFVAGPNKKPRVKWRDVSTTDPDQIKEWFKLWPDALPAIDLAKSGHIILDGDRHGRPDGVAAAEQLFAERSLNAAAIPTVITPQDGRHYWFMQPTEGKPLGNSDKPIRDKAINVRGAGGYVIAPGTRLPDGRQYKCDANTPSALEAVQTGTVPVLPPAIEKLLRAKGHCAAHMPPHNGATYSPSSSREESYALAALNNVVHKIASTPPNTGRNIELNNGALSMGHMVAAGWISRATVEGRLLDAAGACGLVKDDGQCSVLATIKSGLDAGEKEPHAPLPDREGHRGLWRNRNGGTPEQSKDSPIEDAPPWSPSPSITPDASANGGASESNNDYSQATQSDDEHAPPWEDHKPNGNGEAKADAPKQTPLQWANTSKWDVEPCPRREWAVTDRIPLRQVTLFSGEGAIGKSLLELMLGVAHVTGKDWLGSMPEPGGAFYFGCEDDENELRIRLGAIIQHYETTFEELHANGFRFKSLAGEDAVLGAPDRNGIIRPTALYDQLYERAGDLKPKHIGIDTSADVFAGNEIDRTQVRQFISLLRRLAIVSNGSVVLLSHPSLTGINSGTGISGSTAWHNSVRARMYMTAPKLEAGEQPDSDQRELQFKKSNYGRVSDSVVLRYQRGLFLPEAGLSNIDKAAREAKVDEEFLAIAMKLEARQQEMSPAPTSHHYAPTLISKQPEAKGIRKSEFVAALDRLLDQGKVRIETLRPGSSREKKIIRAVGQ